MDAIHAVVDEVRRNNSGTGCTKIILEIPKEHFSAAARWIDMHVLVTLCELNAPLGPIKSDNWAERDHPALTAKDSECEQTNSWI